MPRSSLKDASSTRPSAQPATAPSSRGSLTGGRGCPLAGCRRRRTTPPATPGTIPDDVLFRIVKEGTAAVVGGGYESDMPGFGGVLSDAEIHAVLSYIKSTWPERERSYQESVSDAN